MQSKYNRKNRVEADPYGISPSIVYSEPWWHSSTAYNTSTPSFVQGNASDSSSLEQSIDSQSQSDGVLNEEDDDATKAPQDRNYGQIHQNAQHAAPTVLEGGGGSLAQQPQLELIGHSIVCASNPYTDSYYGGMMAAYGQPMVHPQLLNMHNARMPLPLEMAQDPIYVNAKQYHGILRRRQSRAKAELEKKLVKVRKPYLHESRHQHAMRRARGTGGRFAKKPNTDNVKHIAIEKAACSAMSSLASNSSFSESIPTNSDMKMGSHHHEAGPLKETYKGHALVDGCIFGNCGNLQKSAYQSRSMDREECASQ